MTRPEFLVLIDDLLELPKGTLTGEEKLENLEGWNSLALICYMSLVDEHLGVKLSPRQFVSCESVNDLLALAKAPSA
jgi:acyl carrier protein